MKCQYFTGCCVSAGYINRDFGRFSDRRQGRCGTMAGFVRFYQNISTFFFFFEGAVPVRRSGRSQASVSRPRVYRGRWLKTCERRVPTACEREKYGRRSGVCHRFDYLCRCQTAIPAEYEASFFCRGPSWSVGIVSDDDLLCDALVCLGARRGAAVAYPLGAGRTL